MEALAEQLGRVLSLTTLRPADKEGQQGARRRESDAVPKVVGFITKKSEVGLLGERLRRRRQMRIPTLARSPIDNVSVIVSEGGRQRAV